uniref:Histone deacetylase domain-containing protein n=1 Tax=Hippocampus comes TaxID=109280 RepID=A0A3Q2Z310_HIPCM
MSCVPRKKPVQPAQGEDRCKQNKTKISLLWHFLINGKMQQNVLVYLSSIKSLSACDVNAFIYVRPIKTAAIFFFFFFYSAFLLQITQPVGVPSRVKLTYHSKEYIKNLGNEETEDCPHFEGIVEYAERYSSASINGAFLLNCGKHDKVINWSGGLHHAHKDEPSGFCFANDIVMAIQELLCKYETVMYIDIDNPALGGQCPPLGVHCSPVPVPKIPNLQQQYYEREKVED